MAASSATNATGNTALAFPIAARASTGRTLRSFVDPGPVRRSTLGNRPHRHHRPLGGAPLRTATIANGPKIAVRAASRVMRRTIGTRPACQVALPASTPTTLLSFELLGHAVCWVGAATRHHHHHRHRHRLPQLPVRHLGDHAHQVGASIACKIQLAAIRLTLALKRVEATELVWTFACQAFIGPSRPRSEPGGRAGGWEHLPHPHHPHHPHHLRHPRPHHHLRLQRRHPPQTALQAFLLQVEAVWTNPPVATPTIDAS